MPDDLPRPDHSRPCRIEFMDLHVAARLRRRRVQLQLEPQLVDVAIGEPSGTVERVEKGEKRLGASQLYNLAVALGVGVAYFFADEKDDDGGGGDSGGDRHGAPVMPATDPKALSEAKRFARAVARISSPEIKHMITDLLKSLVPATEIPAIAPLAAKPTADEPVGEENATSRGSACDGSSPCEKARGGRAAGRTAERTGLGPSREGWRGPNSPETESKRAP